MKPMNYIHNFCNKHFCGRRLQTVLQPYSLKHKLQKRQLYGNLDDITPSNPEFSDG